MRTTASVGATLISTSFLVSCAPAGEDTQLPELLIGTTVTEVGPLVELPSLDWTFGDSEFTVGGTDPRESHQFVEVSDAARRSDGTIIIADRRSGLIGQYDPSGAFLGGVGSVGEGPGEFRAPADLLVTEGDTLLVWDEALWRTTTLDAALEFVGTSPFDPTRPGTFPLSGMWPTSARLGPRGPRLVHLDTKGGKQPATAEGAKEAEAGFALVGAAVSSPILLEQVPGPDRLMVDAPWGPTEVEPPLAAGPVAALSPDGDRACMAHSREPAVLCVNGRGERVGGIRWTAMQQRVVSSDPRIERWRDETRASYGAKLEPEAVEQLLASVPLPEAPPALESLLLDQLDHLWIELGPVPGDASATDYLVVDRDLGVLGLLTLPDLDLFEIGSDYLLGVKTDALGVQTVVHLPLIR